ncbi:hypothetical protein CO612_01205 [Lysobacteraceae bacterium NML71-0210]|nr:hypothetical protein CO612_01205 [Xanthomonadaceae bacterium NML71-0210]
MNLPHISRRDLLLLCGVCFIWALNFLMSAIGLREIPPLTFTLLRFTILGLVLLPFVRRAPQGQGWRLFAVSTLIGVVHFSLCFWGVALAGELSSPAILLQSYIPMTAVLAWVWLGEKFGWRTGLAIAVSFLGVLVLSFDPQVLQKPAAVMTLLLSALALAIGTVMMRGLSGVGMLNQQAWTALCSIGPLALLSVLFEPGALAALPEASLLAWSGVIYAALASSLLGHGLYFMLVQRYPVAVLMPWLLLAPVIAIALGIVFWGDKPGFKVWLGGAMVLGGVLVIALRKRAHYTPQKS